MGTILKVEAWPGVLFIYSLEVGHVHGGNGVDLLWAPVLLSPPSALPNCVWCLLALGLSGT